MKFVCGKCNAKYNVSDERVAGKVLKIRCKTCGEIIEVSGVRPATPRPGGREGGRERDEGLAGRFAESFGGKGQGALEGTPGLRQAVKQSAARLEKDETSIAIWFVAVDDKPVGPVTAASVWRYRTSGKVNADSLVWKEGMPDWQPLRDARELAALLEKLEAARSRAGAGAPAVPGVRGGAAAAAPQKAAAASPLRGQRLGRLGEDVAPTPAPSASPVPATLDEGPSALGPGAEDGAAGAESDFFGEKPDAQPESSRIESLQQISPPLATGHNRWVTVAAVGFLGISVAVLVIALTTGRRSEPRVITEVVEKVVEVEKEKIVYRDGPQVAPETGDGSGADQGRGAVRGKGGAASAGGGKKTAASAEEKKKKLLEEMGLGATSGDQQAAAAGGGSPAPAKGSGSSPLTSDQIRRTYNSNRNSMQICYERSLKQGEVPETSSVKAETKMVVGGSGMVKSVTVSGQAAQYPGLKSCIEKSVKKWVFPPSSGESPVEIPTLFSPK